MTINSERTKLGRSSTNCLCACTVLYLKVHFEAYYKTKEAVK